MLYHISMKRHSQIEIKTIIKLRKSGHSIPEIMKATGLPKTTIWRHVQGVAIDPVLLKQMRAKQGGSTKRKNEDIKRAFQVARVLMHSKNKKRELCILASMLYWAEGSKRELVFTNTDISMVNIYLKFIQSILMIRKQDIHMLIRIADPINPSEAVSYWENGTSIHEANIKVNHNNIQNKTKTQYGICRVSARKGGYSLKVIQGIISTVKEEFMPL